MTKQGGPPQKPAKTRGGAPILGEFLVSLPRYEVRLDPTKLLILLAHPTGFEPVTSAFGGLNPFHDV
ncbi:hypothetical protein MES4922_20197 [Mesorhizobium ventifaucium]|uniref:Uncharacterized protein n=1 Tax=Mesorhizobium ventifaucium TaxID=666020 RepID=A0ABN8JMS6_9HYPH|nr:hypothetical protein MES4922_20197 [Mesorhizobium ventifaucium]